MIVYWHNPRINFCQEHTVFPCQFLHMGKYSTELLHVIAVQKNGRRRSGSLHEEGKKMYIPNGVNNVIPRAPLIIRLWRDHLGFNFRNMVWKMGFRLWSSLTRISKYPCLQPAGKKKICTFISKILPLWWLKCLWAVSFTHETRGLSCSSAVRHVLKKILLNHTWKIFCSLRNAVMRCNYT